MEILNQYDVLVGHQFGFSLVTLLLIIGACLCFYLAYKAAEKDIIVDFCIALMVLCIVFAYFTFACRYKVYETRYQVILNDISAEEFNEKYEIVEQQGKIYVVRDRNEETFIK